MFRYNKTLLPRWLNVTSIDHDFETKHSALTLSISNNQLKCCSAKDGTIEVHLPGGKLLQTYGARGSGDAGQLLAPYITDDGDDNDGSVLIADCGNDRLQVMSEQGEFSVLQLQPTVSRPCRAALFNNQLYIISTSLGDYSIYKYSC